MFCDWMVCVFLLDLYYDLEILLILCRGMLILSLFFYFFGFNVLRG